MSHRRLSNLLIITGLVAGTTACNDATATNRTLPEPALMSRLAANDRGPIRLRYECGNTFRIRHFGADSTTVWWKVVNTTDSGKVILRGRGSSPHADTTFTTTLRGTVQLTRNGTLITQRRNAGTSCSALPRLVVVIEQGVTEKHALHDSVYKRGSVVHYDFRAERGFTNVLVTLDGDYVSPSGKITMDGDHVLIASADSMVALSAAEKRISSTMRAMLVAADPTAAYRALVSLLLPLSSRPDFATMLQRAEYFAFDPIADSAALARVDAVLTGQLFTIVSSTPSAAGATRIVANVKPVKPAKLVTPVASAASRVVARPLKSIDVTAAAPRDSLEPTTFVYVNGMYATPAAAAGSAIMVANLMRELPRFTSREFAFTHFYSHPVPTPANGKILPIENCVARIVSRLPFLGSRSIVPLLQRCVNPSLPKVITETDAVTALTQYAQVLLKETPTLAVAGALADTLQRIHQTGRHLILVPHSQGTMMVQQAMSLLRSRYAYDESHDSAGISVVPLAAPTSLAWPFPAARLKPVTIMDDFVADAGTNSWPRLATPQGSRLADLNDLMRRAPGNDALLAYVAFRKITEGIALHAINTSYLASPAARVVRDSAASAYQEMAVGELVLAFVTDQLNAGTTRSLGSYVTVYNQNDAGRHTTTPLMGRNVAWRSTAPSIASVDDAGRVLGSQNGTATIWSRSWSDSASAQYTVIGAQSGLLEGYFTGYWVPLDYDRPFIKQDAWMQLSISNGVLGGTVGWSSGGKSYSAPVYTSILGPTGVSGRMTLLGPDPELIDRGGQCIGCTQVISIGVNGNGLYGTSAGMGMTDSREWVLTRVR